MNFEDVINIIASIIDSLIPIPAGTIGFMFVNKWRRNRILARVIQATLKDFQKSMKMRGTVYETAASCLIKAFEDEKDTVKNLVKEALEEGEIKSTDRFRETQCFQGIPDDILAEVSNEVVKRILGSLWEYKEFRDDAASFLIKTQAERLEQIKKRLDEFKNELPETLRESIKAIITEYKREEALEQLRTTTAKFPEGQEFSFHELKAQYRLIPFTGKESKALKDEIVQWAKKLNGVGLRWLYGAGGAGKTRLMVEVGEELKNSGWNAYFLPLEEWEKEHMKYWVDNDRPTMLIVDYAEMRKTEQITDLLNAAIGAKSDDTNPLALVLLTREAPRIKGSQSNLLSDALQTWSVQGTNSLRREIFNNALREAKAIPPLDEIDRVELFKKAVEQFRERLRISSKAISYDANELPSRPLAIILLAFLFAQGRRDVESSKEEEIYSAVWDWEKGKWEKTLKALGLWKNQPDLMKEAINRIEQLQVAATLGLGFSNKKDKDIVNFWQKVDNLTGKFPLLDGKDLIRLAGQIPQLFAGHGKGMSLVPAITPDPLADFVMANLVIPISSLNIQGYEDDLWDLQTVMESHPLAIIAWAALPEPIKLVSIELTEEFWVFNMLKIITRLRDAYPDAGQVLAKILALWLEHTVRELYTKNPDFTRKWLKIWEHVLPSHPERTVALRELVASYYKSQYFIATDEAERASWANNLSVSLSALGRRKEALEVAREAMEIRRRLASENPQAFEPDLAMSLNNLATSLSYTGRREEALKIAREAVKISRRLARKNPQAFEPDLAVSLANFAALLSDAGQREEALEVAREAVALYRKLAKQNPQAFEPDLAMSLNNLATSLSYTGRREEALKIAKEAVDLYRKLAKVSPQAFEPDLAMSLNNLAALLSDAGQREEALKVAKEAVEIRRRLASENPQAFEPDLAMSLNNLAIFLSEAGRREEALKIAREAVEISRRLARKNPQAFEPDLAMSLTNLAALLSDAGQREEALKVAKEAVEIRRGLASENPQAFEPDLAMSLTNLATFLSDTGQREEALKVAIEAMNLYRKLAKENPQAFEPYLAMSLTNLAKFLSDTGQREEALKVAREAVDLYRKLAKENPQAFEPYLALSLNNLAAFLSETGRREEALKVAIEAMNLYRKLAKENPQAFEPYLAGSLTNLANSLSDTGRREEALKVAIEAMNLYRKLAKENPQAFEPYLAMSLTNLAKFLSDTGQRGEALKIAREAVEIRRKLAKENPQAFEPDLAASLDTLANRLSETGRREEALKVARDAVDLYRKLARENPQAFEPDLARSLGALGYALSNLNKPEEAMESFAEGIKILIPYAQKLTQAYFPILNELLDGYLQAENKTGKEPNSKLIKQVEALLNPE